jgi:beta-galactosidase
VVTAGKPHHLKLEADRQTIAADGQDLSYVTVTIVDKKGNPCPTASTQLNFEVKGNGRYRAACNGDATSLELFHLPTMKAFNGKLVVLVQSTAQKGEMELTVSGEGLQKGKIVLNSVE